ncbi:Hypothetical predicted protein, partial [Paramuricea clavata]
MLTPFNTAYYLTISERPYSDTEDVITLNEMNDGSTDQGIAEQEALYLLFISSEVESPSETSADGLKKMMEDCFPDFDIENFSKQLASLNVDGVSVNMGSINGIGVKLRYDSPWLLIIHCFNHRLELAVKDAFKGT